MDAKFRCLIVEDEFTSRNLLNMYLTDLAFCDIAVDGPEAIIAVEQAFAAGKPYRLFCLDINLPNMSGMDVLKQIRREEARYGLTGGAAAKVIMTTSANQREDVLAAYKFGCEAYLLKPVNHDKLMKELARLNLYSYPSVEAHS